MQLTLIRHGETSHNAAGKFQGWADIPLNALGHEQARRAAQRLATEVAAQRLLPVTAVHSSDLSRARQTAEAVAQACRAPLTVSPKLREINIGLWEGCTYADMEASDAAAFAAWPWQAAPQGETFGDVAQRASEYVSGLTAQSPEPTESPESPETHTVLVSHGLLITALLCELLDWNPAEAWATRRGMHANTALTTLQFDPGSASPAQRWQVVSGTVLGCTAHLTAAG